MWRCNNVGGIGEHVICHVLVSWATFFFLYAWARAPPPPVDWFRQSIRHIMCFRASMCFSGVSLLPLLLGDKIPQTHILGAWIGIFKPNAQNVETCTLSKLLNRFQPSAHRGWSRYAPNKSKRWTAAVLKKNDKSLSPQPFDRFWLNLASWRTLARHNGYLSKVWPIFTKFGMAMQNHLLTPSPLKIQNFKIKGGGRQPWWRRSLSLKYLTIPNGSKPPFQKPLIIILTNKIANIIKTKLASVSLCCKIHCFKTANIKFFCLRFLSTEVSFYIHDRPPTGKIHKKSK